MKNQPKIIRERKQSLNKNMHDSQSTNKQNRPRTSSSLPKKMDKDTLSIIKTNKNMQGQYMFVWGNVLLQKNSPRLQSIQAKKLAKNVVKFAIGQKHLTYINHKNQVFGIGTTSFGQLGYFSDEQNDQFHPIPILQDTFCQQIFCTSYCTFVITSRDEVYGCGLNNRGQLGIGTTKSVGTPVKIHALTKKAITTSSHRLSNTSIKEKSQKKNIVRANRINSVALAEKTLYSNQSKLITQQFTQDNTCFCLLQEGQYITSIDGGPYHTLALTNFGRVFYSGNIYKKSTIVNDEFTSNFTQLNLKKIGKVQKIKAGLTSIGLLNMQGNLYVLGALSQNIVCDEPYNTGIACIVDFIFTNNKIGVLNSLGQLYYLIQNKKSLKTILANNRKNKLKFQQIVGGFQTILCLDQKGQIYMQTYNSANKNEQQKQKSQQQITFEQVSKQIEPIFRLKSNGIFHVGLCQRSQLKINQFIRDKKPSFSKMNEKQIMSNQMLKKVQDLQKQNIMLKDLLRKKSNQEASLFSKHSQRLSHKDNMSNDCNTVSKFQINNKKISQKARTFQYSMEIPFSEIELGKQISEGGYGIIYKGKWRKTTVAIKIFKIDENSDNSIKDFISQCHAMEALRHPNIVMFLGACTKPPTFAIVLQYCEGGTLWSILQRSGEVSWEQRRKFALDIAKGMNYLHQRPTPILHRDLKSLNILLDANKQIKLADFGWTKGLQNYMTGKIGTYQWMAPEVVSSHQYTQKADVFSFGIILWEIASREAPYRNIPGVQVANDVLHKDLRPSIPKKTPENFINLMKRCWGKNPVQRPSFSQIIDQLEKMQLHYI